MSRPKTRKIESKVLKALGMEGKLHKRSRQYLIALKFVKVKEFP